MSPLSLSAYGWTDTLDRAFAEYHEDGLLPARVSGVDRGGCDVICPAGQLRAGHALLRHAVAADPTQALCTGDWVALRPGSTPEVVAALPRRTAIVRASAARSSHGQVLAANVDTVVVVVGLDLPVNAGRLERLLTLAWQSGAQPVVVLTKADQCADVAAACAEVGTVAPGVEVHVTSATTGEGVEPLTAALTGTVVLLGSSGAGKSTLGNVLLGADQLQTGAVRGSDGKGRHTTVRRELLALPGGGVLIDTPGLRGIGLHESGDGLAQTFAEIEELAQHCRFTDCGHTTEPDCAVQAAVAAGELPARRLDSYRKLQREEAWAASRSDARLRAERTDRQKAIARHLRATYRFQGQKPRP